MTIEEKRRRMQNFCRNTGLCDNCPKRGQDYKNCIRMNKEDVDDIYKSICEEEDNFEQPHRTVILEKAIETTNGSRNQDYGKPEKSFDAVAELWTGYLKAKYGVEFELTPKDIALMMVEFKIGRTITGHNKEDNYVDMCGYAANAGEIEYEENNQQ